ncbi:hypothetical protein BBR47_13540 [Brevibacillus brevis NBRC 100599]|uniref:Uncharacterized protein n=1 Tax=Brevibacillus brevis (strain 47 / JCM 6285 / NBRC 100599) TaxID=358681 RepID=C0Z7T8_BREBN|nr:hypothetical protein BBR47_13540 [Brevibacillus brevis NBRC 100599]
MGQKTVPVAGLPSKKRRTMEANPSQYYIFMTNLKKTQ